MIDWLSFRAPFPHPHHISDGSVISHRADGSIEWLSHKRATVTGSFRVGLQVRTAFQGPPPEEGLFQTIEISGNPCKFFQGHNLWGTDDLPSLIVATLEAVARLLGVIIPPATRQQWESGEIDLTRVDVTESFHLESLAQVLAWLRAAEQTAHLPHRGRGQITKGSTLYFGKHSRRWSLKLYAKGQEITAKGHGQDAILELPSCLEWASKALRAELTIRSMELKRLNLSRVSDWLPVDGVPSQVTAQLLLNHLGDMTMTTSSLNTEVLKSLRPALCTAYQSWEAGNDLRQTLPRRTFYKYRKELLPFGVDIATILPKEVSNVVPLYRVLEAKPAPIPEWAYGTKLYFEPRKIA